MTKAPKGGCASPAATPCLKALLVKAADDYPGSYPLRPSTSCCWTEPSTWWKSGSISRCASPTSGSQPGGAPPRYLPLRRLYPARLSGPSCAAAAVRDLALHNCLTLPPHFGKEPVGISGAGAVPCQWAAASSANISKPAAGGDPGWGGDQPLQPPYSGAGPPGAGRPGAPADQSGSPARRLCRLCPRKQMSPAAPGFLDFCSPAWRTSRLAGGDRSRK